MNSTLYHEFHALPWIPYSAMNSTHCHEFHVLPWNPRTVYTPRIVMYSTHCMHSELARTLALQMAFKAINGTAGLYGLVPTLLVYGAYPCIAESDTPSQSISQRSETYKKATEEARKLLAKRQVNDALHTRNGLSPNRIKDLPLNAEVLVWREHKKS